MNKMILIIDKECNEYCTLKERLEQLSFTVHISTDVQEGIDTILKLKPDLIIYDFHTFLISEKEYSEKVTKSKKHILPIIMVHSTKEEEEVLLAFDKGAADYITKPFQSREFEARIKAILRRIEITRSTQAERIRVGELVLCPAQYQIDLKTHKVHLLKKEQEVLLLLIDRKIISREEIIRWVWGADYYGGMRVVDVNISNLRKKIEKNPRKPRYIRTVKGYGYRLDEPVSE